MVIMNKKLQIMLRDSVPREKEIIDYLESCGARTGEPKRLLISGFEHINDAPKTKQEVETKKAPSTEKKGAKNKFGIQLKPF